MTCIDGLPFPTIRYTCFCAWDLKSGSIVIGAFNILFGLIFGLFFFIVGMQELALGGSGLSYYNYYHGGVRSQGDFSIIFRGIVFLFLGCLWIAELVTASILIYAVVKDKDKLLKHFIVVCMVQVIASVLLIIASCLIMYPAFIVFGILLIPYHLWCFIVTFSYFKE